MNCKITGLEGVEARLKELSNPVEIVHEALEAGAAVIMAELASRTPVREGLLVSSLTKEAVISPSEGVAAVVMGYGEQGYIARFVEFGHNAPHSDPNSPHHSRNPANPSGHTPAHPFMRQSMDAAESAAVEAFTASLRSQLDK